MEAQRSRSEALALLRSAGLQANQAARLANNGGRFALRAPTAGVVLRVDAVIGQSVEPGGRPLVHIAAESGRRVEARLAEPVPGSAAIYFVDRLRKRTALELVSRSPRADPADGTTRHWFQLPAEAGRPPGEVGVVEVVPRSAGQAFVVPATSITSESGRAVVVVRRAGELKRVAVERVSSAGSAVMVLGALDGGDEVALDPQGTGVVGGP